LANVRMFRDSPPAAARYSRGERKPEFS
jgi:hypothetical protein